MMSVQFITANCILKSAYNGNILVRLFYLNKLLVHFRSELRIPAYRCYEQHCYQKKNHLIVNGNFLHSLNSLKTTQSVGSKYLEIFMQVSHLRRTDFPINGHIFILKVVTQTCHSLFIGQNIFIYVHIETEVFQSTYFMKTS